MSKKCKSNNESTVTIVEKSIGGFQNSRLKYNQILLNKNFGCRLVKIMLSEGLKNISI